MYYSSEMYIFINPQVGPTTNDPPNHEISQEFPAMASDPALPNKINRIGGCFWNYIEIKGKHVPIK